MSRRRTIAAVTTVVVIALVVAGVAAFVVPAHPSADGTYSEAASSVNAPLNTNASNGQLILRVNNVSDASDPAIANVWASLAPQARQAGVYFRELTPSAGEKNLIANVTMTNAQGARVPFTYTNFFWLVVTATPTTRIMRCVTARAAQRRLRIARLPTTSRAISMCSFPCRRRRKRHSSCTHRVHPSSWR